MAAVVTAAATIKYEEYGVNPGDIFRNLILQGKYKEAQIYISENGAARESIASVKTGDCLIEDLLEGDRIDRYRLVWQVATILHGNDIATRYSSLCRALVMMRKGNPDGYFTLQGLAAKEGYAHTATSMAKLYDETGKVQMKEHFNFLVAEMGFVTQNPDLFSALHDILLGNITLEEIVPFANDDATVAVIEERVKESQEFMAAGQIGYLWNQLLLQIRAVRETGQLLQKPKLEEAGQKV